MSVTSAPRTGVTTRFVRGSQYLSRPLREMLRIDSLNLPRGYPEFFSGLLRCLLIWLAIVAQFFNQFGNCKITELVVVSLVNILEVDLPWNELTHVRRLLIEEGEQDIGPFSEDRR